MALLSLNTLVAAASIASAPIAPAGASAADDGFGSVSFHFDPSQEIASKVAAVAGAPKTFERTFERTAGPAFLPLDQHMLPLVSAVSIGEAVAEDLATTELPARSVDSALARQDFSPSHLTGELADLAGPSFGKVLQLQGVNIIVAGPQETIAL